MIHQHVLFFFIDGVGLAPASPTNPLSQRIMPFLESLLGGPFTSEQTQARPDLLLKGIDATMGIAGLPQSGTGHVALFGGFNAAQQIGHHQPHSPPTTLHAQLAANNIFRRVQEIGGTCTHANPFGPRYWEALQGRKVRRSASVIAAMGAELPLRGLEEYRADQAVAWDLVGDILRLREDPSMPERTPEEGGQILARLSSDYDFVLYEYFLTDLAGHGRMPQSDEQAMTMLDSCIKAFLEGKSANTSLVISSDHGNLEDRSTRVHTRNPVPLLVIGPAAEHFAKVEDITQIADTIIEVMQTALSS
jgi:2,3-bisphosphoglycerate-independent phosphoglycerate mutase